MKYKQITLSVDMNDPNSALLYSVFIHLKRGHRVEILADNILFQQEVQNLMPILGDSPEMLAKILEMISLKHRRDPNTPKPVKIIQERPASYQEVNRIINQTGIVQSRKLDEPSPGTDKQTLTPKEVPVTLPVQESIRPDTKKPLTKEEYEKRAVEIAREYIFRQIPEVEQRKLLMQWAYLDDDELYQDLVIDQLWFEYKPENLPERCA